MTLPLATATNLSSIQILDSSNNQLASSADITFNLMSQALTVTGEPYGVGEMDFVFTSLQKEIEINSEIIVSIGITKMSFHELEQYVVACQINSVVNETCTINTTDGTVTFTNFNPTTTYLAGESLAIKISNVKNAREINTTPVLVTISDASRTLILSLNSPELIPDQLITNVGCDSTCTQCYGNNSSNTVSTECYACATATNHLQGHTCLSFCDQFYTLESESSDVKRCISYVQHFKSTSASFGSDINYSITTLTIAFTLDKVTLDGYKVDVLLPAELKIEGATCSGITAVSGFNGIGCSVDGTDDSLVHITGIGANSALASISFTLSNIRTNRVTNQTSNAIEIKVMDLANYEEAYTIIDSTFDSALTLPLS